MSRTLHWNERARQKSFVVVEEGPKHTELKNEGNEEEDDDDDDDNDDDSDYDSKLLLLFFLKKID